MARGNCSLLQLLLRYFLLGFNPFLQRHVHQSGAKVSEKKRKYKEEMLLTALNTGYLASGFTLL